MIETHTNDGFRIKIPESFHGYKIIEIIGTGSTSVVFLVKNESTGKLFSAKIIPKRYLRENGLTQQVKNEIKIMQKINHENIVKFEENFEIKTENREFYIVIIMEYCENGDLCTFINEKGFENEQQKQKIIHGLLEATKYLHNNSIAHGDIKLENILLDSEYNTKLSDFGYCKTKLIMGDDSKSGTLFYAAPELFSKGEFNTLKTDIWSIGISLFVMYTKSFPFKAGNDRYIVKQIVSNKLNFGSNVPNDLLRVISKCTDVNAENRPKIEDLLDDECFDWNKKIDVIDIDGESEPSPNSESENYCSVYV